ncbi:hypothetical protein PS689_00721 [Pseudomonas fluorescens]|nr:hypothetical protein PS689_00721 [Pseudomonas fluorescens]
MIDKPLNGYGHAINQSCIPTKDGNIECLFTVVS